MKRSDKEELRVLIELETFGDGDGLDLVFGDEGFPVPQAEHFLPLHRCGGGSLLKGRCCHGRLVCVLVHMNVGMHSHKGSER